jgi:hypothetical protein
LPPGAADFSKPFEFVADRLFIAFVSMNDRMKALREQ